MPPRKRRTVYPPPRNQTRPPRPGEPGGPGGPPVGEYVRPTVASINLSAGAGRTGLTVGDRVRINGTGLYSGELATIEKLATGAIPSAVVRTDAGRTRQVRTIDLEPVAAGAGSGAAGSASPAPPPDAAAALPPPDASESPEG